MCTLSCSHQCKCHDSKDVNQDDSRSNNEAEVVMQSYLSIKSLVQETCYLLTYLQTTNKDTHIWHWCFMPQCFYLTWRVNHNSSMNSLFTLRNQVNGAEICRDIFFSGWPDFFGRQCYPQLRMSQENLRWIFHAGRDGLHQGFQHGDVHRGLCWWHRMEWRWSDLRSAGRLTACFSLVHSSTWKVTYSWSNINSGNSWSSFRSTLFAGVRLNGHLSMYKYDHT